MSSFNNATISFFASLTPKFQLGLTNKFYFGVITFSFEHSISIPKIELSIIIISSTLESVDNEFIKLYKSALFFVKLV